MCAGQEYPLLSPKNPKLQEAIPAIVFAFLLTKGFPYLEKGLKFGFFPRMGIY
jgi:hypothetical protein